MANLVRRKQVDQAEFSGFFIEVGDVNYYPLLDNPSGFLDSSALNSATGTLDTKINNVSGILANSIQSTGINANLYTDNVSGAISTRLQSSGAALTTVDTALSGYIISVSGNLNSNITGASGILNTKIDTASGYLKTYTDTVSGVLNSQITAASNATVINSIVSGAGFNFTGAKIFNSPISAQRINLSGINTPSSISIIASSGYASVVGNAGTFVSYYETGANSSLWAVADSAGLPMLELFDDYTLILGHSSRKSVVLSGISGYVLLPSLPNQNQTGSLPSGTLFRSGNYLMIL